MMPRMCFILILPAGFSARRTDLSCRFCSLSVSILARHGGARHRRIAARGARTMAPVTATLARWMGMAGGVTQHAGTDPDQFGLEARQRPVGHGLGQFDAAQEGGEVMGQSVLEQRPCRGPCACPWIARAKLSLRRTPARPLLPVILAALGPGRAVFKGEPFALGVIGDRVWMPAGPAPN